MWRRNIERGANRGTMNLEKVNIPTDLEKAVKIVKELQEWIENREWQDKDPPVAHLSWTPCTLSISIGDFCVFDSEHDPDALTLEDCKQKWLVHVLSFSPFIWVEFVMLPTEGTPE